jgi:low affinity Fe/Cu permease
MSLPGAKSSRPRHQTEDCDDRNGTGTQPCRRDLFGTVAAWTARAAGNRWTTLGALLTVIAWAATGPYFQYSETWQLVINTGTTIVTFLMVFLIQNSQNRESKALHLKLDELIHAVKRADNQLINVESLTEEQLDLLAHRYERISRPLHEKMKDAIEEVHEEMEVVGSHLKPRNGAGSRFDRSVPTTSRTDPADSDARSAPSS